MLNTLQIENFKGWKDTGKIELAPLTLFLGSNSSGKSSVGQLLVLLKQSFLSSDRKSPLLLRGQQSIVDFGLPANIFFDNILENKIKVSYDWRLSEEETFFDNLNEIDYPGTGISFMTEIGLPNKSKQLLEVEKMQYTILNQDTLSFSVGMVRSQKPSSARAYKVYTDKYNLVKVAGRVWEMPSPMRFYGFPPEMTTYHQNAYDIVKLALFHEKILNSIFYLGPMREPVKRTYTWIGDSPVSVGARGEDTIYAMLNARQENRQLNFGYKQRKNNFEYVIAQTLKDMGLIDEIEVKQIAGRQEYDVKVKTKGANIFAGVPDVGYGVSQILPVLVQIFYAPKDAIIIIEQPELHLHPSAQSALADALIMAISARENAECKNIQLLIETHSEHLLRRLQRRVAENKLDTDLFKAYFANNDTSPAKMEPLEINLYGEIVNWPKNFFGDISGDIYLQTDAALTRKVNGES